MVLSRAEKGRKPARRREGLKPSRYGACGCLAWSGAKRREAPLSEAIYYLDWMFLNP